MTAYLVRHGQKISNAGDPGLTEVGRQQALTTAQFFASSAIQKLLSSPLCRTRETADIFADILKLPIQFDERLVERANWDGSFPFEQFMQMWRAASTDRDMQPQLGASSRQTGNKLADVMSELWQQNPEHNVVIVSHGGAISDFLRNISSDEWLLKNVYHTQDNLLETELPECSITTIEVSGDHQFHILGVAEVKY